MNYRQIQPLAWRIHPDLGELRFPHEEMKFPVEWGKKLRRLIAEEEKRDIEKTRLPIHDLNKVLRAVVPDLISIEKNADLSGSNAWLRSEGQATTPHGLRLILFWWAMCALKVKDKDTLEQIARQLTDDQLVWQAREIDLAAWTTHPNNTAKADSTLYSLLPDLVSSRLSANGVEFELQGRPLRFYRIPVSPGIAGAELISWPPFDYRFGKTSDYFSVLATITLQTVPFQPFPEIYIDLGVRRWVSQRTNIPRRHATSVYLRTTVPWIEGTRHAESFQAAQMRWTRDGTGLVWGSHLVDILNQVAPGRALPSPEAVASDPVAHLNTDAIPNMAIVYRSAMQPKHRITAGLMPADRVPLANQIANILAPEFMRLGSLPLVARPKPRRNLFSVQVPETALVQRRQSLATLTRGTLGLRIYYQKDEARDAFVVEITQMLGVSTPEQLPALIEVDGLTLELTAQQLGAMGTGLEISTRRGNRGDEYRAAVNQRIEEIRQQVGHETKPALAFVEIQGADYYEQRSNEADPKVAIRIGLARAGDLSQFIVTESEQPLKERAKRAVLDGFRQLGMHREPAPSPILPPSWNCAGIWLISQSQRTSFSGKQQYIPVVVSISGKGGRVYARVPSFDEWLSYPDALLRIAQGTVRGYERKEQVLPFIGQIVRDELPADGDVLVLCDSQNMRKTWPWLGDGKLSLDALSFGNDSRPIHDWPGLRIVRVRGSDGHETPEWYAHDEVQQGFTTGLFRISDRVFASTYAKPQQFKQTAVTASILERPRMAAWNPALYELTVAATQPGDDPVNVAAYVHSLRLAAVQYNDATALPLPLHLAKLMEEYVLVVEQGKEEGDDAE